MDENVMDKTSSIAIFSADIYSYMTNQLLGLIFGNTHHVPDLGDLQMMGYG